jgi:alkylglycerol monooxygenase
VSGPSLAVLAMVAALAVADWVAVATSASGLERIAKPAVVVGLLVTLIIAGVDGTPARWLLLMALGASLAGDWFLLPPERFRAGLAAFLCAHLAYLALFLAGPLQPDRAAAAVVAAVVLGATAGRPILRGASRSGLRGPVAAYLGVILLMAVAATGSGSIAATFGAWLFIGSDTTLGWDRFVAAPPASPRDATTRRLAVIVPYHAAQLLLTAAVLAGA